MTPSKTTEEALCVALRDASQLGTLVSTQQQRCLLSRSTGPIALKFQTWLASILWRRLETTGRSSHNNTDGHNGLVHHRGFRQLSAITFMFRHHNMYMDNLEPCCLPVVASAFIIDGAHCEQCQACRGVVISLVTGQQEPAAAAAHRPTPLDQVSQGAVAKSGPATAKRYQVCVRACVCACMCQMASLSSLSARRSLVSRRARHVSVTGAKTRQSCAAVSVFELQHLSTAGYISRMRRLGSGCQLVLGLQSGARL